MADCLPSPVKDIGKCIWDCFLKSHFDYWWCFDGNIEGLKKGIVELERKIEDIISVWLLTPRPAKVEKWLDDGTKKLEEARRILPDDNILKAWDIRSRYSLGKYAKETTEEITKLLNEGDLIQKAHPAPSPAMAPPPHRSATDFESRKCIEEEIIKSLKESNMYVIGICGMGGIGKTTMAQKIWKRVKDENLFHEVVMVTVSQKIDMPKIQKEIIQWLGLEFDEKSSMSARAHQLRTRLMDKKSKIIIFDDVWDNLKLDKLGVPFYERCKIILTTRYRDVCQKMEAQQIIAMEILAKEDAWILFKEKACPCVEGSTLQPVAKQVAAECKGLPLALVTVGLALREKNVHTWIDSLKKLKEPNRAYFSEVKDDVYKPLKLSYDYLEDDQQYLFLLCCLFPEDYDIRVDQLIWHIMGLQLFWHSMELPLFDDINNIKEARDRTHNLVEKLKSRFLLIDGRDELHVRMHDVVRDVAIYIGSKEKNGFLESLRSIKNSSDGNCNWMSVDISNERMEVPVLSQFPKLRLLLLSSNKSDNDDTSDNDDISDNDDTSDNYISHISFEGTKDLNVLTFECISIGSLPPTLGLLKNLRTLCLFDCEVETISVIVELTSLKIFSCCDCHNITELPEDIRRLKDLRLLELTGCRKLQRIPLGIISNFRLLEELKMCGSFSRWEAEEKGKERRNASLKELECLRNLSCLEIEIDDCSLSAQEIRLSQKLVKYYIRIGSYNNSPYYFNKGDYEKAMILNLPSDIGAVGKWIQKLVRNTELLHLEGDGSGSGSGSNNFNIAEIEYLRNLRVGKCSTVKKLDVFCSLETLILCELENLEEICIIPNQNVSLCNLKSIEIGSCHKLRSLFSVSVARRWLLQLEVLEIRRCRSMEQVFGNEGTEENTNGCLKDVSFGNLKSIKILECHKLRSLFSVSVAIPMKDVWLGNLKSIFIFACDKLISLFSVSVAKTSLLQLEVLQILYCDAMEEVFWNDGTDDNTNGCIELPKLKELKLLFLPKLNSLFPLNSDCNVKDVSFGNLKSIYIFQCHKLISLFSVSVPKTSLLELEVLQIEECVAMEQVFWNEGTDDNTDGCIEFPKLEELTLKDLPNLTAFWQGLENKSIKFPNLTEMDNTDGCIEFPKLRVLILEYVPNLTAFRQGLENKSIKFPNLTEMDIGGLPSLNSLSPLNSETVVVHDHNTSLHFFCNQKDVSFGNLKSIKILECHKLRSLFSVSVARTILLQLEVLSISSCDAMEQVFWNEATGDNTYGCIEFPKLDELTLNDLPNLTAFWQGLENKSIMFPNLTVMDIGGLPSLNSLSPLNSKTVAVHDQSTFLHFFCNPKVEIGCLKYLNLESFQDNIKNIWCHQIPNNVFNNLETLVIRSINGIRSLMSTSIAKNLTSLKNLSIFDCGELVEVIERDEDDDKQAVDFNCLFPSLIELEMWGLPKLKKFWHWNYAMELPLLEDVHIEGCPIMETFTLRSINTPNIKELWVNNQEVGDKKDMNDVIRYIWTESQDKFKTNEDENENEDEDENTVEYTNKNVN